MKLYLRKWLVGFALIFIASICFADNKSKILFISSASDSWHETLANDFPNLQIYNEGNDTLTFSSLTNKIDGLAKKYPDMKTIVINSGENDIALPFKTPVNVAADFKNSVVKLHTTYPEAQILVLSLKPCPAWIVRANIETVKKTNELLQEEVTNLNELAKANGEKAYVTFIDVYPKMLAANGKPNTALFAMPFGVYLNANGYRVWRDALTPFLYADI